MENWRIYPHQTGQPQGNHECCEHQGGPEVLASIGMEEGGGWPEEVGSGASIRDGVCTREHLDVDFFLGLDSFFGLGWVCRGIYVSASFLSFLFLGYGLGL